VRKCTLYCKLHSLALPKTVRTRLLHLVGNLYNPRKDLLILKCQRKRTFVCRVVVFVVVVFECFESLFLLFP
jgi:hypothetical protein